MSVKMFISLLQGLATVLAVSANIISEPTPLESTSLTRTTNTDVKQTASMSTILESASYVTKDNDKTWPVTSSINPISPGTSTDPMTSSREDGTSNPQERSSTALIRSSDVTSYASITTMVSTSTGPIKCRSSSCNKDSVCVNKTIGFFCLCPEGFTGETCNETVSAPATVVPNTIKVSPDRGPRAGGTNLTLFTLADITIYIDVVTLKITAEIYKYCNVLLRNATNLIVQTPPYDGDVTSELVLSIKVNNTKITWNTGHRFTYKPNPLITDIRPNSTITGGRTRLTVSGTSLDAVVNPKITYRVSNCSDVDRIRSFTESCGVHNMSVMLCLIPDLTSCEMSELRYGVSVGKKIKPHIAIMGFILDGYTKYNNVTGTDLHNTALSVYDPPVLQKLDSPVKYQKGVPLEIRGEHLNRGVTVGDYMVSVGEGTCVVDERSFTASAFECLPPEPIPKKSNLSEGRYHVIKVKIVNVIYDYGNIWYPWWYNGAIVIPAAFAVIVVTLVVVMTPILIRSYRNRSQNKLLTDYVSLQMPVIRVNNRFENREAFTNRTVSADDSVGDWQQYQWLRDQNEPGQTTADFFRAFFKPPKRRRRKCKFDRDYRAKYGKRLSLDLSTSSYTNTWMDETNLHGDQHNQQQSTSEPYFAERTKCYRDTEPIYLHQWPIDGGDPVYTTHKRGNDEPFYVNITRKLKDERIIAEPSYESILHERRGQQLSENFKHIPHDRRMNDNLLYADILPEINHQVKKKYPIYENSQEQNCPSHGEGPFYINIPKERMEFDWEETQNIWQDSDVDYLEASRRRRLPRIFVDEADIYEACAEFDMSGVVYDNNNNNNIN